MIDSGRAFGRLLAVPALLAGLLLPSACEATLVGPGDLAFVRFHCDGINNMGIVLLADADAGQRIGFHNGTLSGDRLTGGDFFIWEITDPLSAGTVVTFNRLSHTNPFASDGLIYDSLVAPDPAVSSVMLFSLSGETVFAYLPDPGDGIVPETFLGALSTESPDRFDGTGLVNGETAVYLPPQDDFALEAHYVGPRTTETDFADYLTLISDVNANWERRNTSGSLPEFDSSNFTLQNGATVPESPVVATCGMLILLAGLSLNARRSRQPAVAPAG